MRAFEIRHRFGIDALTLTERPEPHPGPGQVLVKLRAASLNYRDLLLVQGLYDPHHHFDAQHHLSLPLIPVSDGVGEIVSLGAGVTTAKVGERVAGVFAQKWLGGELTKAAWLSSLGGPLDGMLAEYALLHEDGVVQVPEYLTDEEAATLPVAAVTAWQALITEGGLTAGDTVLVQGTGGVSIFALQFAMLIGARIIVTSSSDAKLERARHLGASEGINYRSTPAWEERVLELTDGVGVDHIVEVGGAGTLAKSLRAIRLGGRISLIGVLSGFTTEINPLPILFKKVRVQGILVGPRETFEAMNRAIALHRLRPVVDRVFLFKEAPDALHYMASGAHFGKISIRL